jgi:GT2 family glycosyltransferase
MMIRPLGAIDWAIRRQLGRWFNNASTASDIAMIQSLARYRADECARLDQAGPKPQSPQPAVTVACVVENAGLVTEDFLSALRRQNYPDEKISLLIAFPSERPDGDDTPLPLPDFAQWLPVPKEEFSSAYAHLLARSQTELLLFVSDLRIPMPGCLRRAVEYIGTAAAEIAAVDLAPTPTERPTYCDPVTLDLPSSLFSFTLARKSAIEKTGGFQERCPVPAQGLELSYRLRNHGFRLICKGRSVDFAGQASFDECANKQPDSETLLLLQRMYGGARIRLHSLFFYRMRRPGSTSPGIIERAEQMRTQSAAGSKVAPSRLWSGELDIGTGLSASPPTRPPDPTPLVSILIRTYKGRESWLRQSLASALNQTYPDLEVIIIEDGSKEFEDLVRNVNDRLPPGQSVRHLSQAKHGKALAGNLGLESCAGELIGFLDDDDLLLPGHVELLYNALRSEPAAVAAYALAWEAHTPNDGRLVSEGVYFEVPKRMQTAFDREKLKNFNYLPIQAVLFHRSCYERKGGFDPDRTYLEDWALWDRYADLGHFSYLPVITSIYRTPADPYERFARVGKPQRRNLDRRNDAANKN